MQVLLMFFQTHWLHAENPLIHTESRYLLHICIYIHIYNQLFNKPFSSISSFWSGKISATLRLSPANFGYKQPI